MTRSHGATSGDERELCSRELGRSCVRSFTLAHTMWHGNKIDAWQARLVVVAVEYQYHYSHWACPCNGYGEKTRLLQREVTRRDEENDAKRPFSATRLETSVRGTLGDLHQLPSVDGGAEMNGTWSNNSFATSLSDLSLSTYVCNSILIISTDSGNFLTSTQWFGKSMPRCRRGWDFTL